MSSSISRDEKRVPCPHVVVTGAMGVGKTTVGRVLADELQLPFLDSDEIIETRTGDTGSAIAAREGVSSLHQLELEVFLEIARSKRRSVIAPASSVVDSDAGRRAIARCLTIWLTAPTNILVRRQASGDHRRSVNAAERELLRATRKPHLESLSDLRVDTGSLTPYEVVEKIVASLQDTNDS